ncbi:MAG: MotA/TolQ/ExbB proton channel family protein [Planctomycetia bacterium]|nr:MotA/TolQ/ExbB proton channel family protein [Planctomycetia bacterium]
MKQSRIFRWIGAGLCSAAFLTLAVGTFSVATLCDVAQVVAQDEEAGGDEAAASSNEQSLLMWTYTSLGPLYSFVFLGISFALVALGFKYFLALRRAQNIPPGLAEQFETLLNERRFQEAYEMTKNDDSYLGQVLSAGLAKLASGYDKSVQAMQETSDNISMGYEHGLSYVGLIAGTATMVGLLGTVHGMIMSFQVIATSVTAPKPNELAGGISTAMFTTMVGLVVAIPALVLFQVLKNRLSRTIFEVGVISEDLLGKVLASAQKK